MKGKEKEHEREREGEEEKGGMWQEWSNCRAYREGAIAFMEGLGGGGGGGDMVLLQGPWGWYPMFKFPLSVW